jgi:hypothetical protein
METAAMARSTSGIIRTVIWSRNDMTISVDMPDGSVHDFPDGTPPEKIKLALQEYVYRQGMGRVDQGLSGLDEGLANLLGAPIDIANAGIGLGMRGVNALFGTSLKPSEEPLGGSAGLKRSLRELGAIRPESDDPTDRFVRRTAQSVGASLPVAAMTGGIAPAAGVLLSGLTGGLGGATANQVFPGSRTADILGEMAGSLVGTGGVLGALKGSATRTATAAVPSRTMMEEQAGSLYTQAAKQGVTATGSQTKDFLAAMKDTLRNDGLLVKNGDDIVDGYPKLKAAYDRFAAYAGDSMTVEEMRQTRKLLQKAARSGDASEARLGTIMIHRFDDAIDPLAPQLKQANKIYHAAAKSEELNQAIERARLTAAKSQGTSYATALRNEFAAIDRDIINNGPRGWTPVEVEAIKAAARGTLTEKTLRGFGKLLAPQNALGFITALGAGGTGYLGSLLGGSVLGPLAGPGVAAFGAAAQAGSNLLTRRAADLAELLTRSGVKPVGDIEETLRKLMAGSSATLLGPTNPATQGHR